MNSGAFRTDDVTLATALALAEFSYEIKKVTEKKVLWVFTIPEGREDAFDDVVDDYSEFNHSVECRTFVTRWLEMRKHMFDLAPPRLPERSPIT